MAEAAIKKNVLYMYKNLLKMAKGLPEAKRDQSLKSIKEGFRNNVTEVDPQRVEEMLKKAQSTLGN
jgi:Complex 1 protein (LYR family)